MPRKKKIALLGGGMASITAAFELTRHPGWQDQYEVSVYTAGFRLGGKGASGRNRRAADRIEEHGLHILSGSYDNTFAVLRRCYAELGRPPGSPLSTVEEALERVRRGTATGESLESCEVCGRGIPRGRREAIAGVRLCVACQTEREET